MTTMPDVFPGPDGLSAAVGAGASRHDAQADAVRARIDHLFRHAGEGALVDALREQVLRYRLAAIATPVAAELPGDPPGARDAPQ